MNATEGTIRYMSTLEEVLDIEYNEIICSEPEKALEYTSSNTILSVPPENTTNFTGLGIKVGVLESVEGTTAQYVEGPNIQVQQLLNADITCLGAFSGGTTLGYGDHATRVVSLIVGQPIEGNYDQGIAPDATLIGASFVDDDDFKNAADALVAEGVDIISMRFGLPGEFQYGENDRYVDQLIIQNNISVVKSAGNRGAGDGKITSPGHAYNAITVGSIALNTSTLYDSSSYNQSETPRETNKPDVCALGYRIIS